MACKIFLLLFILFPDAIVYVSLKVVFIYRKSYYYLSENNSKSISALFFLYNSFHFIFFICYVQFIIISIELFLRTTRTINTIYPGISATTLTAISLNRLLTEYAKNHWYSKDGVLADYWFLQLRFLSFYCCFVEQSHRDMSLSFLPKKKCIFNHLWAKQQYNNWKINQFYV